jgi:hypothetical protein
MRVFFFVVFFAGAFGDSKYTELGGDALRDHGRI